MGLHVVVVTLAMWKSDGFNFHILHHARIAQLGERDSYKVDVGSSSLSTSTIISRCLADTVIAGRWKRQGSSSTLEASAVRGIAMNELNRSILYMLEVIPEDRKDLREHLSSYLRKSYSDDYWVEIGDYLYSKVFDSPKAEADWMFDLNDIWTEGKSIAQIREEHDAQLGRSLFREKKK